MPYVSHKREFDICDILELSDAYTLEQLETMTDDELDSLYKELWNAI